MDAINTVQLSNHTGYKHFSGQKMNDKELSEFSLNSNCDNRTTNSLSLVAEVFRGIVDNNIHKTYTHLLTGYVGSDLFLRELAGLVKTLREQNPDIIYCKSIIPKNSSHQLTQFLPLSCSVRSCAGR